MMRVQNETRLLIGRTWTLFVDGENFARRGQDVLHKAGVETDPEACERDVYLWLPGMPATEPFFSQYIWAERNAPPALQAGPATRAYYYTSMPNTNARKVQAARLALRGFGFEPRMFPRRRGRSKAVDLALATDALTLAGEGAYEVAVILAGDGDYVPVVEAIKRLGRHVVVGFFADSGLNDEMRIAADDFIDLTPILVSSWQQLYKTRVEVAKRIAQEPVRLAEQARLKAADDERRDAAQRRRAEREAAKGPPA